MPSRQITQDEFFDALWKRFQAYSNVLANGSGGLVRQILVIGANLKSEIKGLDFQYKIFGKDYWGYGVNYIDDSVNGWSNQDIKIIERIPEQNKHIHFNIFNLLIFRVENSTLTYHILSIDTCSGKKIKHINHKKKLDKLNNVTVTQYDIYSRIKLHFDDNTHFSFDVDYTYRVWDYTPDYKNVFDAIIENNKNGVTAQQKDIHDKLNLLLEKINSLAESQQTLKDGQQIIYDDFMELAETNAKPDDKELIKKIKGKVTDILVKKGLNIVVADAIKEVEKLF